MNKERFKEIITVINGIQKQFEMRKTMLADLSIKPVAPLVKKASLLLKNDDFNADNRKEAIEILNEVENELAKLSSVKGSSGIISESDEAFEQIKLILLLDLIEK